VRLIGYPKPSIGQSLAKLLEIIQLLHRVLEILTRNFITVLILDTFEVGRGNIRFILELIQFELSRWSNSELLIDCFNTIKRHRKLLR